MTLYSRLLNVFVESKQSKSSEALPNRQIIEVLSSCLYSKGHSAFERLVLFKAIFLEKYTSIAEVGDQDIDQTTLIFAQNIINILREKKEFFTSRQRSNSWPENKFWIAKLSPNLPHKFTFSSKLTVPTQSETGVSFFKVINDSIKLPNAAQAHVLDYLDCAQQGDEIRKNA